MMKEDLNRSQDYTTTTVALVTSRTNNDVNVMSAEWSIRVSIDPFLIGVMVGYQRETYKLIAESGEFGINYCSDEQGEMAHIAGNYSLKDTDKFKKAGIKTFQGKFIKAPLITGCISVYECRVVNEFKVGDHAAFIGEVLNGYYDDSKRPLVFHRGKFFHLGDRIVH
ncbi:MAG: flavin reductase family protein [Candidatus Thermoplasmatota archaeon]|nr:flavin reductase family protein [Candidatus Thermoplasmatota archaeon]